MYVNFVALRLKIALQEGMTRTSERHTGKHQVKLLRIEQSERSTLGHLYINGIFACYTLEDALRKVKIAGQSAIPAGAYCLRLNTWGGQHAKYAERFPQMHQGMLEIVGIPDFSFVYLHLGNTHRDTAGCPLTGFYWRKTKGDFVLAESALVYAQVYPLLLDMVLSGMVPFQVENLPHLKLY